MNEIILITIIKTFFMNVFILLLNYKLINENITLIKFIKIICISLLISVVYTISSNFIDNLLLMIISYFIQLKFMEKTLSKENDNFIMIATLISNSIVYILFSISAIFELIIIKFTNINSGIINLFIIL